MTQGKLFKMGFKKIKQMSVMPVHCDVDIKRVIHYASDVHVKHLGTIIVAQPMVL